MKEKANLRIEVDKALAVHLKQTAGQMNVPVTQLVRTLIQAFLDAIDKAEEQGNSRFEVLARYSLGACTASFAMQTLSVQTHEELAALLKAVQLPPPSLPEPVVCQMVEGLKTLASF